MVDFDRCRLLLGGINRGRKKREKRVESDAALPSPDPHPSSRLREISSCGLLGEKTLLLPARGEETSSRMGRRNETTEDKKTGGKWSVSGGNGRNPTITKPYRLVCLEFQPLPRCTDWYTPEFDHSNAQDQPSAEMNEEDSEKETVEIKAVGAVSFVIVASAFLVLLFFFMSYSFVLLLIVLFCIAGSQGLHACLLSIFLRSVPMYRLAISMKLCWSKLLTFCEVELPGLTVVLGGIRGELSNLWNFGEKQSEVSPAGQV
ncbi:hypothetical protein GW17_00003507 [Ensete ventricosum]|nr:hypothetical protein GW17_00003507 [Ensete ventricosum]